MKIEDIDLSLKKNNTFNNRKLVDIDPDELENLDALETVVNSKLSSLESKLSNFLSENPVPDSQEAASKFDHLKQLRNKTEVELVEMIDRFGDEGLVKIRETVGKDQRTVEERTIEIAGEKRKDDLKYKVILFSFLHNMCADQLREMSHGKILQNGKTEKKKNERNINLAQMQQYLAMSLIRNSRENYPLLEASVAKLIKMYNFPNQQSASLEGGVLGLVGAYHYYRKQGYKVLFSSPETDATKQTDLYLVRWGRLIPDEKKELFNKGIESIDDLPLSIREEVMKVQVKCHANDRKPTREIFFDLETNSAYSSEADLNEGKVLFEISDYEYPPDESYLFFKNRCSGLTNGRFFDIKMDEAKSYAKED